MIMQRGVTEGVIMAPGAAFMKDPSKPCNAIRASFSKASYEEMNLVSSNYVINSNLQLNQSKLLDID